MTKQKLWKKVLSLSLAGVLGFGCIPAMPVLADGPSIIKPLSREITEKFKDQGYSLVWYDEFEGTSLDLNNWNVEPHEPGWVNEELQEYPDADEALGQNLIVDGGYLTIQPKATLNEEKKNKPKNLLKNALFSGNAIEGWTETIADWDGLADATRSINEGVITYDIAKVGTLDWHVQLKQSKLNLINGNTYRLSFDVESTAARKIKSGFMSTSYAWYGGGMYDVSPVKSTVSYEFTMKTTDAAADFYISMGQMATDATDDAPSVPIPTAPSKITISNLQLVNLTNPGQDKMVYDDYDFTSGRINTENWNNFTYGMFEARAKVPKGEGYLPAFWLMAANETADDEYGVWPTCGEIDMMEVKGDETNKLHGTIHYGLPREQKQGTYTKSGVDFSEDFHVFRCEWEPGKITWYVDDQEYYTTSNWYSTSDDGKTLTYPAPFDHDMYVILNLAVGNEWVGYPDQATIDAMADQKYMIDYVRVYQKESYDENVTEPEYDPEQDFRKPDADGNYINNGDFSTNEVLNEEDGEEVDWNFKQAAGGIGSAEIVNGEMIIHTTEAGTESHSIQLVQPYLPVIKGKKYQLTYRAKASQSRKMKVSIQNVTTWNPYTEKIVDLTDQYQTFTDVFNVYRNSDPKGRLDINMGSFDSTADIYLDDVSLKIIGDADPEPVDPTKYPRKDGNRIYNGGFEEGENRLGFWEIESKNDAADAYVTNGNVDGKRIRKLVVNVSDQVSSENPVVIRQNELLLGANREYNFSMDVKGAAGKKAEYAFADVKEAFTFDGTEQKITKVTTVADAANDSFAITLTEPGNYEFDNIYLAASDYALIKNGDFSDYGSSWTSYVDSTAKASYDFKGKEAKISVENIGSQDYHIQLNQENVNLEKGKKYKLSFKAKSDTDRKIKVTLQHNGEKDGNWTDYSGAMIVGLTDAYRTFSKEFTMEAESDPKTRFNVACGVIDGEVVADAHNIYLDDIVLEEVKEEGNNEEQKKDEPAAQNPAEKDSKTKEQEKETPADLSVSNHNGKAEKGETAVTKEGTFTALNGKTASFKPAEGFQDAKAVIPAFATIDGTKVKVTRIEAGAYKDNKNLKEAEIGKNIEVIDRNAFAGCKSLKKIKIYANKLKKVNAKAFKGCPNKKSTKVTIYAKNKKQFKKAVKLLKKAGLKKATYKFKKAK